MRSDRRQHARIAVSRPCKMLRVSTQRYESAVTTNVSVGGALMEIAAGREFSAGEELLIAIAWNDAAVVRSNEMIRAEVVRSLRGPSGRQMVALRFTQEVRNAMAA
jgi:hypothetical protein